MKNGFFKKADIVLFVVLLVLGIGSTVLLTKNISDNAVVEITIDGKNYASMPLDIDDQIHIENEFGINDIVIKDKTVYMQDASCSNKDCVHMGHIQKEGQSIICLPHKLIVTIVGGEGIDATAY